MIDDRNNVQVRHVNVNNRFSESVPDYEDVKVSFFFVDIFISYTQLFCKISGRLRGRLKYLCA